MEYLWFPFYYLGLGVNVVFIFIKNNLDVVTGISTIITMLYVANKANKIQQDNLQFNKSKLSQWEKEEIYNLYKKMEFVKGVVLDTDFKIKNEDDLNDIVKSYDEYKSIIDNAFLFFYDTPIYEAVSRFMDNIDICVQASKEKNQKKFDVVKKQLAEFDIFGEFGLAVNRDKLI